MMLYRTAHLSSWIVYVIELVLENTVQATIGVILLPQKEPSGRRNKVNFVIGCIFQNWCLGSFYWDVTQNVKTKQNELVCVQFETSEPWCAEWTSMHSSNGIYKHSACLTLLTINPERHKCPRRISRSYTEKSYMSTGNPTLKSIDLGIHNSTCF